MPILNVTPKYTYKDLTIVPSEISSIRSRKQCVPFDKNGYLPLFTAPMPTVVDNSNFQLFEDNKIHTILPRTEDLNVRLEHSKKLFSAFSLQEFENNFIKKLDEKRYVLIDIANGHMRSLYSAVEESKKINGKNICIMIGNIANPNTYEYCVRCGVDYVRVSIGTGSMCLTTTSVSVHYPIASLINEINQIKKKLLNEGIGKDSLTKIIADGGIRDYSDIIKALALGADYVMCGFVFAKMLESAAKIKIMQKTSSKLSDEEILNDNELLKSFLQEKKIYKDFFGMSTKKAQKMMHKDNLTTSEGVERKITVDYTMKSWIENFNDYLRSAMSYCNVSKLEDFIGKPILIPISTNSFNLIDK